MDTGSLLDRFRWWAVLWCAAALAGFGTGCGPAPDDRSIPRPELPVVSFNGYDIPKFPTAQGQLNYARSFFTDPGEKQAALSMVRRLFPHDRSYCGTADLILAYRLLGNDYRFARRQQMLEAVDAYRGILLSYPDLPEIQVKANWYLGWIYCELVGDRSEGLVYFRRIVKQYPDIAMELSSPVPWVSLVYPENPASPPSREAVPKKHWAGLALLEIVRHTPYRAEAVRAFRTLAASYRVDAATAVAARLMLSDPYLADAARPLVPDLLAPGHVNPYLAEDLLNLGEAD